MQVSITVAQESAVNQRLRTICDITLTSFYVLVVSKLESQLSYSHFLKMLSSEYPVQMTDQIYKACMFALDDLEHECNAAIARQVPLTEGDTSINYRAVVSVMQQVRQVEYGSVGCPPPHTIENKVDRYANGF